MSPPRRLELVVIRFRKPCGTAAKGCNILGQGLLTHGTKASSDEQEPEFLRQKLLAGVRSDP